MAHFLLLFVGYSLLGALGGAAFGGAVILLPSPYETKNNAKSEHLDRFALVKVF